MADPRGAKYGLASHPTTVQIVGHRDSAGDQCLNIAAILLIQGVVTQVDNVAISQSLIEDSEVRCPRWRCFSDPEGLTGQVEAVPSDR